MPADVLVENHGSIRQLGDQLGRVISCLLVHGRGEIGGIRLRAAGKGREHDRREEGGGIVGRFGIGGLLRPDGFNRVGGFIGTMRGFPEVLWGLLSVMWGLKPILADRLL